MGLVQGAGTDKWPRGQTHGQPRCVGSPQVVRECLFEAATTKMRIGSVSLREPLRFLTRRIGI